MVILRTYINFVEGIVKAIRKSRFSDYIEFEGGVTHLYGVNKVLNTNYSRVEQPNEADIMIEFIKESERILSNKNYTFRILNIIVANDKKSEVIKYTVRMNGCSSNIQLKLKVEIDEVNNKYKISPSIKSDELRVMLDNRLLKMGSERIFRTVRELHDIFEIACISEVSLKDEVEDAA